VPQIENVIIEAWWNGQGFIS